MPHQKEIKTEIVMELTAPVPFVRKDKLIASMLAAVVLVGGYWWMVGGVCGIYHDDAIYISTAKALASGQGYRLINLPGAPIQTKYPIIYPAVLALIWKLWPSFPKNLLAMQALSLLMGGAVASLFYLYLVRFGYFTRGVAAAACVLAATSINFLYFSTLTLSEIPFALLLVMALWALEDQVRAPQSIRIRQVVLGVVLALPFMCRTIGITLAPIGLLVLYRQKHPVFWVALTVAAIIFSWLLWILTVLIYFPQDSITGYYTDYLTWWSGHGLFFLVRVFFYNLFYVMFCTGFLGAPGLEKALLPLGSVASGIIFYMLGITTWIVIVKYAKNIKIMSLYLISYLFMVVFWPWPPFRFLIPILPLLLAHLIYEIMRIVQRLSFIPYHRGVLIIGMAVLLTANLTLVFSRGKFNQGTRYPSLNQSQPAVFWSSYEAIFTWLRAHTSPDEVLAGGLDPMIYLYTGRRAFRPFVGSPAAMFYGDASQSLGTPADLLRVLKAYEARYLIQTPLPDFGEEKPFAELVKKLRLERPGMLQPVFVAKDPRFVIFAVGPGSK